MELTESSKVAFPPKPTCKIFTDEFITLRVLSLKANIKVRLQLFKKPIDTASMLYTPLSLFYFSLQLPLGKVFLISQFVTAVRLIKLFFRSLTKNTEKNYGMKT